jgi:hypothetical protein
MPISNMQQPRQMYNEGGMLMQDPQYNQQSMYNEGGMIPQDMNQDMGLMAPRQNYGLGSFVKKAIRGVKKVAKSPLGKMALIGAAGMIPFGATNASLFSRLGASGMGKGLGGFLKGGMGNFMGGTQGTMMGGLSNMFRVGGKQGAGFSAGRLLAGGLGAAAVAAPFMMGGGDDEEEAAEQMDVELQRQRARNFYSGQGDGGAGLAFMPDKQYVKQNFYAADGGRAGYANGGYLDEEEEEEFMRSGAGLSRRQQPAFLAMGGGAGEAQAEQMLQAEFIKYKNKGGELSFQQFVQAVMQQQQQAQGMQQPTMMAADGGRMNYAEGGGIMETEEASEMIDMGGQEKDYRETGGFVEMGGEERADDVPARLSKNEFVFTADAVRQAGGGDIDQGSEVMQNLMDNLEQGGQVSEDSQGMGGGKEMMSEEIIEEPDGAQAMYEQQQALQSRMI